MSHQSTATPSDACAAAPYARNRLPAAPTNGRQPTLTDEEKAQRDLYPEHRINCERLPSKKASVGEDDLAPTHQIPADECVKT